MASAFSGLYSATTGLYASQAAMSVATNNISNANTDGYSRKTVTQSAIGPAAVYISSATTGSGTKITSISRERDALLDAEYWDENSVATAWETKSTTLGGLEDMLEDISSEDGFDTVMSDFSAALEDVSTDPGSTDARTCLQQAGQAVCDYLNSMATSLSSERDSLNEDIKTTVTEINSYSERIAALNQQIQKAQVSGTDASDLEDQRDLLIDKLSSLANVDVTETSAGTSVSGDKVTTLVISLDGGTLVNGSNYRTLDCHEIVDSTSTDNGMYEVVWSDTGDSVTAKSGQLGALLELRDGTGGNGEFKGVPYYMSQLDEYAQTLAEAFNEGTSSYSGHIDGYDSDGDTGICFFTYDETSSSSFLDRTTTPTDEEVAAAYSKITAANISLSHEVLSDVSKIAASSSSDTTETENAENILGLIDLCASQEVFGECSLSDYLDSMTATLGTATSYATTQSERHDEILSSVNTRRASVSSVSTTEETTNLVLYQEAFAASAKSISMWQEVYQTMLDMVNG